MLKLEVHRAGSQKEDGWKPGKMENKLKPRMSWTKNKHPIYIPCQLCDHGWGSDRQTEACKASCHPRPQGQGCLVAARPCIPAQDTHLAWEPRNWKTPPPPPSRGQGSNGRPSRCLQAKEVSLQTSHGGSKGRSRFSGALPDHTPHRRGFWETWFSRATLTHGASTFLEESSQRPSSPALTARGSPAGSPSTYQPQDIAPSPCAPFHTRCPGCRQRALLHILLQFPSWSTPSVSPLGS